MSSPTKPKVSRCYMCKHKFDPKDLNKFGLCKTCDKHLDASPNKPEGSPQ